jgi:hypothetical protein
MIASYFDDSSDEKMAAYVCAGGILEDEFKIAALEARWHEATKTLRKPFRSAECEAQRGQFATWKKKDCDALMAKLVGLMSDGFLSVGAFGTVIPIPLYKSFFPNSRREAPYLLAVRLTIIEMARLASRNKERIQLWFEEGPYQGKIAEAYRGLKHHKSWKERESLDQISFGDKRMIPLQAADLVAREGFKVAVNMGKRPVRKPLARLWNRAGIVIWTRECLQELKDRGGPESLNALTSLPPDCNLRERPPNDRGIFTI